MATLEFKLNENTNEGYLFFSELPDISSLRVKNINRLMNDCISDNTINEGYPSKISVGDLANKSVQSAPYPKLMLTLSDNTINEGYLYLSDKNDLLNMPVQVNPYPKLMLQLDSTLNEGYPSKTDNIDLSVMKVQEKPYPKLMLWFEKDVYENYLSHGTEVNSFGAFANTPILETVTISKNCKYIADYAFYNSGIKEVKISKDCVYEKHSFPENCEITYYN